MAKIAIIGLGLRLPGGADNKEKLWDILAKGVDCTIDVPKDRWNIDLFYNPDRSAIGKTHAFRGGYLNNIDKFDAGFFGITPREASSMDPQQRILLETSWEAFEDAGIDTTKLAGKDVGVYIGAFTVDYKVLQFNSANQPLLESQSATGDMMTMVSNRLSYVYNFTGPSMSIDTACSSSLVSLHLACKAIENNECSMAIAGGVNIMINPQYTIAESKGGFLSPDGRCKSFDAKANGYARGEGAGIVVLKPLDKAIEDNDNIYCVIEATAVNQDGHTKGITVPNGEAQEKLMEEVYENAGISAKDISYIEAHGTGTRVGDPIEAKAIGAALGKDRSNTDKCFIGSMKSNIGHLESAAGVAATIKASLMLKKKQIPPSINFNTPNPNIPFDSMCIKVPTKLEKLPSKRGKSYIGINCFGFGGTNAHVVMSSYSKNNKASNRNEVTKRELPYVLTISARSETALMELVKKYKKHIRKADDEYSLEDLCYSAARRRAHHNYRMAIVFNTKEELCEKIDSFIRKEDIEGVFTGGKLSHKKEKAVFVYTGMGPIWWAMGRQLLETNKIFRGVIEKCDKFVKEYSGWSLIKELMASEDKSKLGETLYAQPANFALQIALTEVWKSLGVIPSAIVGHSVGEVAAAFEAGIFSFEDAMKVIIERSRWINETEGKGTMLAAGISEEEAKSLLEKYKQGMSIAVINSSKSVTLSGKREVLESIKEELDKKQVFAKFLNVNAAYHSYEMDKIVGGLKESLLDIKPNKAKTPIYSTVTGKLMVGTEYGADYWCSNVRNTVRFKEAITNIADDEYDTFIEVGPHPVLKTSIQDCFTDLNKQSEVFCSIRRKKNELMEIVSNLASLYVEGYSINWEQTYPVGSYIELPKYAWQREKYWIESELSQEIRLGKNMDSILGRPLRSEKPSWETEMSEFRNPFLSGHKIQGAILFPATGYIELAFACAKKVVKDSEFYMKDIQFSRALFLNNDDAPIVRTSYNPSDRTIEVFSRPTSNTNKWTSHCISKLGRSINFYESRLLSIDEIKDRCTETISKDEFYKYISDYGFQYGTSFQGVKKLWRGEDEVLALIEAPIETLDFKINHVLHPALLDSTLQSMISIMPSVRNAAGEGLIPMGIKGLKVYKKLEPIMWTYAKSRIATNDYMVADLKIYDRFGQIIAEIDSIEARNINNDEKRDSTNIDKCLYSFDWEEKEKAEEASMLLGSEEKWVVLCDKSGFGSEFIKLAQSNRVECIPVEYASNLSGEHIKVNPEEEESFEKVFIQLSENKKITKIINLWPLDAHGEESIEDKSLKAQTNIGSIALLNMLKAISKLNIAPKIWTVTKGSQFVNGIGSEKGLYQSSIWGISRVFGYNEKPELWGGIVDIDVEATSNISNIIALFKEIVLPDRESEIAFRDNKRFVSRINRVDTKKNELPIEFDKNSSYLITGAFGALGMLFSKWMIAHGARNLILMGRTALPNRCEWRSVDKDSKIFSRIQFVKELERLGANIHIANVDVSDKDKLKEYVELYKKEDWPKIAGVIHTAGIVRDKPIDSMDLDTFRQVFAPKVQGSWNLHEVFSKEKLDFFILFASVASKLIVSAGQSNYASANAFIDALANYRRSKGLPALAIDWGPWSEVGMAEELDLTKYFEERGVGSISPAAGEKILESLIGTKLSEVCVVPNVKWSLATKSYLTENIPLTFEHLLEEEKPKNTSHSKNTILENDLEEAAIEESMDEKSSVENRLKNIISDVTKIDASKIKVEDAISDLGIDSMMANEIKHKIKVNFDIVISVVELLKGNSIKQLADVMMSKVTA
ncbi:acyl transferase domain-containing protein/acyl carrier protein [Clostridium acetobutylicum]|uniref:Polyketide synthase pksE (Short-chain alcohol dehydrogenase,acyl-carrier-protein S-malonyltransferase,3-oxoacyl-(Acyl-carrier-protein) synthase I domains) n=1 Tax=Clostridium acetobutylicum (strain ATCC 824 / DSM 792 / JCM 1419 / IAM 19013 / LMG 5710 / NBRC 13948 / NRRL B-527 / VKM B-1787 / 2291 / W) TaxID=272562 RepID=Q97DW5_CLOAB|nr:MULTISPECIES: type I polyketide synthase [Clostridium]AAK81287.1 Polyketide synthase pksE (short-chain alcohol dehydrogenase,acyl-carrier-protein S-malonyltransferase,3-oxoacyl-(acyl-carrier-protein) synthase I domains) [Clostridium acetobutylicum ATCC 824]ADZ22395.1 Polyketide synthase pksE (short-chain alcohol dehydrogenase,acyl-carrier-protein S-malonyltransferase,3-oxoacyl-(acyl-carrier-protein) synthase I domains) [Clostridium acetobutylicum EA 2018]AEI32790.1 polyketide synthase PksE [C